VIQNFLSRAAGNPDFYMKSLYFNIGNILTLCQPSKSYPEIGGSQMSQQIAFLA
jgi:hypothetical protein